MTLYILDTDHVSLFQREHPQVVVRIRETLPEQLAVTIITVEEQLRGRLAQIRRASHKSFPAEARIKAFAESVDLEALDPELKWLMENGWILEKCRGESIALKGDKLIAHGTLREVLSESKRRGIEQPYTQYIPKSETEWLLGRGNFPISGV